MAEVNTIEFGYGIQLPIYNSDRQISTVKAPVCGIADGLFVSALRRASNKEDKTQIANHGVFKFFGANGMSYDFWAFQKTFNERTFYIPQYGLLAAFKSNISSGSFDIQTTRQSNDLILLRPVIANGSNRRSEIREYDYYKELLELSNQLFERNDRELEGYNNHLNAYWHQLLPI